jgi:hypothetical protein
VLGDAFADAIEAGDPMPFGLGLAVAFSVLEAAGVPPVAAINAKPPVPSELEG